uniref:Ubiquitinyl hydrolase 1 n=1 Tax=Macrostomum lignano TaxID=282301 RepID=A0A1I8FQI9_9PLAT
IRLVLRLGRPSQSSLSSASHRRVICYSSRHYAVFLRHRSANTWSCLDDSRVTPLGPNWCPQVVDRLRCQPLPASAAVVRPRSQALHSARFDSGSQTNGANISAMAAASRNRPHRRLLCRCQAQRLSSSRNNRQGLEARASYISTRQVESILRAAEVHLIRLKVGQGPSQQATTTTTTSSNSNKPAFISLQPAASAAPPPSADDPLTGIERISLAEYHETLTKLAAGRHWNRFSPPGQQGDLHAALYSCPAEVAFDQASRVPSVGTEARESRLKKPPPPPQRVSSMQRTLSQPDLFESAAAADAATATRAARTPGWSGSLAFNSSNSNIPRQKSSKNLGHLCELVTEVQVTPTGCLSEAEDDDFDEQGQQQRQGVNSEFPAA